MNKRTSVIVIVVLSILLILSGAYTIIHYFHNYSSEEWFQEKCGRGYTLIGKEFGAPLLNGKTEAQIELYDNNKKKFVLSFDVRINNNGASLSNENYLISYNSDYIIITLYTYDKNICGIYRFYYDDLREMIRE